MTVQAIQIGNLNRAKIPIKKAVFLNVDSKVLICQLFTEWVCIIILQFPIGVGDTVKECDLAGSVFFPFFLTAQGYMLTIKQSNQINCQFFIRNYILVTPLDLITGFLWQKRFFMSLFLLSSNVHSTNQVFTAQSIITDSNYILVAKMLETGWLARIEAENSKDEWNKHVWALHSRTVNRISSWNIRNWLTREDWSRKFKRCMKVTPFSPTLTDTDMSLVELWFSFSIVGKNLWQEVIIHAWV